jgi:hypothetical protein
MVPSLKGDHARRFVHLLGTDAEFRRTFARNPAEALRGRNIPVPGNADSLPVPERIPETWVVNHLAWPQPQKFSPWFGDPRPFDIDLSV